MTTIRLIGCALVILGSIALAADSHADQWNKRTVVTLQEPMQIPGTTLQPGTYVFRLVDSQANRHIVRVLNEDETQVIATIVAAPNFRLRPTGDTALGFWESPAGAPVALRTWFYPGDNFGQEFAYPKAEAAQLASTTGQNVPALEEPSPPQAEVQAPPVEQPRTEPAPAPEQQPTPAPETTTAPPAAPEPQPPPPAAPAPPAPALPAANENLPSTASPLPLVGLLGLLAVSTAFVMRSVRPS